jgi:hypothetical protein
VTLSATEIEWPLLMSSTVASSMVFLVYMVFGFGFTLR